MASREDLNARFPETTDSFKCSRCGNMYPTQGKSELPCPVCGNVCTPDSCRIVEASTEDY